MEGITMLCKFRSLVINSDIIGLSTSDNDTVYFCTPKEAVIIGWTGVDGIHFCFIPSVDKDMVFVVSPMPCGENYVEPVARNFPDFLSLIVCCKESGPLEQISWLSEADFNALIEIEAENLAAEKAEILNKIQSEFAIDTSINPYGYVKSIQKSFTHSSIPYSDLFYELTGLERLHKYTDMCNNLPF